MDMQYEESGNAMDMTGTNDKQVCTGENETQPGKPDGCGDAFAEIAD